MRVPFAAGSRPLSLSLDFSKFPTRTHLSRVRIRVPGVFSPQGGRGWRHGWFGASRGVCVFVSAWGARTAHVKTRVVQRGIWARSANSCSVGVDRRPARPAGGGRVVWCGGSSILARGAKFRRARDGGRGYHGLRGSASCCCCVWGWHAHMQRLVPSKSRTCSKFGWQLIGEFACSVCFASLYYLLVRVRHWPTTRAWPAAGLPIPGKSGAAARGRQAGPAVLLEELRSSCPARTQTAALC